VIQPFPLRYSWAIRWLLSPLGLGPSHSGVEVYHGFVRIHMGWAFRADVPRTSVVSARRYPRTIRWTAGARTDFRGRWLVNAAGSGIVELTIRPPAEGWTAGFSIHPTSVMVGVADPDGFLAALAAPAAATAATPDPTTDAGS
jgi:hypothetical protein